MTKDKQPNNSWWKNGVIYQIYPRSFMDSNNDGIGDIKGIISKLDYLNDGTKNSLGVDALWISPMYTSPMKDFGYDISDYHDIDGIFGNLDDFKLLLSEAHHRGIKIIMDLVVNHTSDEHPWFVEARKDKNNPKRDWYIWHKNTGKKPNNWVSLFEMKNAWWLDKSTNEFYLGTFTKHQPELNWRNPELKKEVYNMIRYWLDMGVDGFRLDVVNWFIKDDQYRNNPWKLSLIPMDVQKHIYDRNRPETHDICKEIRAITDEYTDRMLVGEIYTNDTAEAVSYQGKMEDELHMTFNFNFLFQRWSAKGFYNKIKNYYTLLPKNAWPNFTLSNHDQPRHYFRYKRSNPRAKVAIAMLMTLRGTPFIYYGEEIGMSSERIARKHLQDPLGKKGWPFIKGRDAERTPMQWDSSKGAGFSTGKPWLPVNPDYQGKNVCVQSNIHDSLLSFYKALIWMRKDSQALSVGHIDFLQGAQPDILAYKRNYEQEEILIILNFSSKQRKFHMSAELQGQVLLGTHRSKDSGLPLDNIDLHPYEAIIIKTIPGGI